MASFPSSRRQALALALACAATCVSGTATAQSNGWPDKPIRMIVPFPAGGVTDVLARLMAEDLGQRLGQNVIIDNRPGANGGIGITAARRSPVDGYTVLFCVPSIVQNPLLYASAGYDPFRDFLPVSEVGRLPLVLTVSSRLGVTSLADFVEKARVAPGRLTYGSYGTGSSAHLYGELFQDAASIRLLHVPYKGASPAIADLVGGTLDAVFASARDVSAHVAAGKARSFAVVGTARAPLAREVPTFREQGYEAMDQVGWFAMFVPAGTPEAIVRRLSTAVADVVRDPSRRQRIEALGVIPVGGTPEQLVRTMQSEHAVWSRVIKEKNIRIE